MAEILAIADRANNAELMVDCFELGYIDDDMAVLDPTYGKGRFWRLRRPRHLVASDIDPAKSPWGAPVDFTAMPWGDRSFASVVFDPPYKLNGRPSGGGPASADDDYGVGGSKIVRWQDRHALVRAGIDECVRVLMRRGHLLVKCADQVSSGTVRWQTREFAAHAESRGCALIDMMHLVGGRPQPSGRRQVHARRNYSTLLVLQKKVV